MKAWGVQSSEGGKWFWGEQELGCWRRSRSKARTFREVGCTEEENSAIRKNRGGWGCGRNTANSKTKPGEDTLQFFKPHLLGG